VTERPVQRHVEHTTRHYDDAWNKWLSDGIDVCIEQERERQIEILARLYARIEDTFARLEDRIDELEKILSRLAHERPAIDARPLDDAWQRLQAH
jgi:hypothetical protein